MYSQHPEVYYSAYGKNTTNMHVVGKPLFIVSLPPLMGAIHFVVVLFQYLTPLPMYRNVLQNGTQAVGFTRLICVLLMGCVMFILHSWYRNYTTPEGIYFDNSDVVFTFCILQFTAPYAMNCIGLPSTEIWYLYDSSVVFWITAFSLSGAGTIGTSEIISVLLASFMVIMTEACHEADLRQKYAMASQWTTLIGSKYKSTDSSSSHSFAFSSYAEYNPHVPNFLEFLQKRVDKLEYILAMRGINDQILVQSGSGQVIGRRFERQYSKLFEVRQLCRSLRGVLIADNSMFSGTDELSESQFAFSNLCITTFAMVESSRGRGHALFTYDDMPEVHVKGPKSFIRMILYLLIVDAIDKDPVYSQGVVTVKCHMVQGRWTVVVSVTRVKNKQVSDGTSGREDAKSFYEDNEGGVDTSNNVDSAPGAGQGEGVNLTGALREVLMNRGHSTPDLAASLAGRYLDTKIEMTEETNENGHFRLNTYSFVMPGLVSQVVGMEAHSDHLLVHQNWVLLTWRNPNARDIFEHYQISQQLKTIGVPFETSRASAFLESWGKRYNVVVVSESNINFNHTTLAPLLRRIACKVIVVSEHSEASPDKILKDFGLRARVISSDITINELLPIVSTIYSETEPRTLSYTKA